MVNKKKGILVFIFFLLAVVGLYLIFGEFNFYKSGGTDTTALTKLEKDRIISLVRTEDKLSESDKKSIFKVIKGNKINDFHFSSEELDLIMKALNK